MTGINVKWIAVRAVLLVMATCTLLACGQTENDQKARDLVDAYFLKLKKKDYDFAETFYRESDRGKWRLFISDSRKPLGKLLDYEIRDVEVNTVYSGRLFVVKVASFNSTLDAYEYLTVFRQVNSEDYVLQSHKIKPLQPGYRHKK